MKKIQEIYKRENELPVKVLQFGEGNFLRAFVDYLIDTLNEKGIFNGAVTLCQPIERGLSEKINEQNGLYTLLLRGIENGEPVQKKRVIKSVRNCINPYEDFEALMSVARSEDLKVIVSNTTEAGIAFNSDDKFEDAPPSSYPAKLTKVLFERYTYFKGNPDKKLLITPVELIENNGDALKKCALDYIELWSLGEDFANWVNTCCFANTLVDRIVTGFPKNDYNELCEEFGYTDELLVTAEPFFFWALEIPEEFRDIFPVDKAGLNVVLADDISGYKMRKVRILNGAHTSSVLDAYLAGYDIVRDMMHDDAFDKFLKTTLNEEIIPFIPLPLDELNDFASAVFERFNNPFIDHKLLDISLNSVSKYTARCLPSVLSCFKGGVFPKHLLFSLACLIEFYHGSFENGAFIGKRGENTYEIRDNADVLKKFDTAFKSDDYVNAILSDKSFWGLDLTEFENAEEYVKTSCESICKNGVKKAMELI